MEQAPADVPMLRDQPSLDHIAAPLRQLAKPGYTHCYRGAETAALAAVPDVTREPEALQATGA